MAKRTRRDDRVRGEGWWMLWTMAMVSLVRLGVGLHPYSGRGKPPTYGDYEAQRHWMEITLHTPMREWYKETENNPLAYWGLDYPPLSAYQSWIFGKIMQSFEPEAFALKASRGYETYTSKVYMRWSVVIADVLFLFPGIWCCIKTWYGREKLERRMWALAVSLLQPAMLLIDHGHFQYNGISLGLAVGAASAIANERMFLGAFLYCLSLNHKQMSLYYAPAFFFHLLGRCFKTRSPFLHASGLALVVFYTFAICWLPWIDSEYSFLQVLRRIMPFERGLYEDHVANFWCTSSLLIKWKKIFVTGELRLLCLVATGLTMLPSCLHQLWKPSKTGLLYAMANCSFCFYMFSFQVHEKSILLPVVPVTILVLQEKVAVEWLAYVSTFSMYPLLARDGLSLAYLATLLLFWCVMRVGDRPSKKQVGPLSSWIQHAPGWFFSISLAIAIGLHVAHAFLAAPSAYPYLYQALITAYSFVHLTGIMVDLTFSQLRQVDAQGISASKAKHE